MKKLRAHATHATDPTKTSTIPRQSETGVVVECGPPDQEAVRSVIKEWLVPLLVKEFLAEQEVVRGSVPLLTQKPTFKPLGEEGGDQRRTPNR